MRRKRRWRNVLYFFVGLLAFYGIGCFYLASRYVRPGVTNDAPPPKGFAEVGTPNVWASSGLREGKGKGAVYVLVHGYGGNQARWGKLASALEESGNEVVIPALPGHDNRTSETSGFGRKEADIVVESVAWARTRFATRPKVVVVGISMGGAACWLASEKDPTIDAVVTEGSFAQLNVATERWFNRKGLGLSFLSRPIFWFASAKSGIDPNSVNPVEAAKKWKGKRALVIHGEADSLFPREDAQLLADAASAPLWIVPNAGHAHCSDVAFDEYLKRLLAAAR